MLRSWIVSLHINKGTRKITDNACGKYHRDSDLGKHIGHY